MGGQPPNRNVARYECPQCRALITQYKPYASGQKNAAAAESKQTKKKNKKDNNWKPPVKSEWLQMCEADPKLLLPSSKTIAVKAQVLKWLNEAPEDKILSKSTVSEDTDILTDCFSLHPI